MKGCDFSMGIYTEKRDQLIEKIKGLEKRIASDTAKKKTLEDKLKEVSRLAMAEEYNCKPRELDEIITSEHSLLQKGERGRVCADGYGQFRSEAVLGTCEVEEKAERCREAYR